jgi:hypothetical protein
MTTEFEHIVMGTNKAKKSVIANSIGFTVGVLITVLTLFSHLQSFFLHGARLSFVQ